MRSLMRKVATCLVCIAGAVFYARSHSYRDPGSIFFDEVRAYEERYSKHRKTEVEKLIDLFTGSGIQTWQTKAGRSPRLCVAISSVARAHTQYLEVRDFLVVSFPSFSSMQSL